MEDNKDFVEFIYDVMSNERILFSYLGNVTPYMIDSLLKGVKYHQTNFKENAAIKKKVYKIVVECLENLGRHNDVKEKKDKPTLFMRGKNDDHYFIYTGNYVYNHQIDSLKKMMDEINSLDKEEIKAVYREVLAAGKISHKGGAGLGMFDIALKSENKLEYLFIPVDKDISFYIMKSQVSSSYVNDNNEEEDEEEDDFIKQ